jgi:hypothetical protein
MKRYGRTFILGMALLLFSGTGVFAQNNIRAIIQDLSGTVEVKAPGSSTWQAATKGQAITEDTVISTGFGSHAVIAVGNSVITVRPITRLSLTELRRIEETETVGMSLTTGRARVDVNPPAGAKADFTVQSTNATASVRGTSFEFDTINLTVNEGTVAFFGTTGGTVLVDAGSYSYANESTGRAVLPEEGFVAALKPEIPYAVEQSGIQSQPQSDSSANAPANDSSFDVILVFE